MSAEEMACQELVEVITDYLEGKMSAADRERFESHLQICPGCQNYLDQMRVTILTLGRLPVGALAPDTQQELLALFRNWKTS